MSDVVTLALRGSLDAPLEADGVAPHRLATLASAEIAALPVRVGARAAHLGDFFHVKGERSAKVRIAGDVALVDGLGSDMAGGELVIDGDAGCRVAAGMSLGVVRVLGSVGDDAGMAMSGGTLRVGGNAGERLGSALPGASRGMTGGEIVVAGSAGAEAAARVRRGFVVIAGDAGARAARAMIAGTLVVLGRTAANPGRGSKRGSVVAVGGIAVPPTYQYACTFRPSYLRFMMTYLRRHYGLSVDERVVSGCWRRYCGDAGDPGKGEILEWVPE